MRKAVGVIVQVAGGVGIGIAIGYFVFGLRDGDRRGSGFEDVAVKINEIEVGLGMPQSELNDADDVFAALRNIIYGVDDADVP